MGGIQVVKPATETVTCSRCVAPIEISSLSILGRHPYCSASVEMGRSRARVGLRGSGRGSRWTNFNVRWELYGLPDISYGFP